MKTQTIRRLRQLGVLNLTIILGLSILLLAPTGVVDAQSGNPPAPLSPKLTWLDNGPGERAFSVNGDTVTLPGITYKAVEEFNLDGSDEIAPYYSTPNLANLGWNLVNTAQYPNGTASVYYHSDGVFMMVEFVGCEDNPALTCMTVWESDSTEIAPKNVSQGDVAQQDVGTLGKSSPVNAATNIDTSVTLKWTDYTGSDFNHYRYCIDTTNDNQCDPSLGWTSVWSGTSVTVSSLLSATTYYWQIQAVLDDGTKVSADNGNFWAFTTKTFAAPGAFTKTLPVNGATNQPATPVLVWQVSSDATDYLYCLDTTNNNICDNNWVSTGNKTTVTLLSGLGSNITYYWQVRSVNSAGLYYGDGGVWASFTTGTGPANDTIDSAYTVTVPYEDIANTVPATIDDGTTNICSPATGLASVWYKYIPTATRKIYLDTLGTTYDTFIAIWTRNVNGTLNPVICNDNYLSSVVQSSINVSVTYGTTYYIQVAQKNPGTTLTSAPGGSLAFHIRNFADVPGNSVFWKFIEGIYAGGVTSGCATSPDLLYCPSADVTRAQMAIFLLKAIHGSAYNPPGVGTDTGFLDVPVDYWASAWIKQLAVEGITSGCTLTDFCPEDLVTRAQMAVFLLRGAHGSTYSPPDVGSDTGFTDVDVSYWSAAWIKELAAEQITSGCASGLYCPEDDVTREQMAVFLSKAFGIPALP